MYKVHSYKGQGYIEANFKMSSVLQQPKNCHQRIFANRTIYSDVFQKESSVADLMWFGCQCKGWTDPNNQLDGKVKPSEEIKDEPGTSVTEVDKQRPGKQDFLQHIQLCGLQKIHREHLMLNLYRSIQNCVQSINAMGSRALTVTNEDLQLTGSGLEFNLG